MNIPQMTEEELNAHQAKTARVAMVVRGWSLDELVEKTRENHDLYCAVGAVRVLLGELTVEQLSDLQGVNFFRRYDSLERSIQIALQGAFIFDDPRSTETIREKLAKYKAEAIEKGLLQ